MAIYNQRYFDYMYIYNMVTRKYRRKKFYEDDFLAWCAVVETQIIPDVDFMIHFEEIGIDYTNGLLPLPCNIHRLLDVFDISEQTIFYQNNGTHLYGLKDYNGNLIADGTTIYLNYIGTNIDVKTGIPLCLRGHEFVCETYCKIQAFEEDVTLKNFDANMYALWINSLPGLIAAAKQDVHQHISREMVNRNIIIRANMIPMIGKLELSHNLFRNNI